MSSPIDLRSAAIIPTDKLIVSEAYRKDLEGILIPEGTIQSRVARMAEEISKKYFPQEIMAVCILDGAMKFYVDLLYNEHMWMPFEIQTTKVKTYQGTESQPEVEFKGFDFSLVKGRPVLVVEDIIDTGQVLSKTIQKVNTHDPLSVEVACLLDKPERRLPGVEITPEYCGFVIPNKFIVGYGLDYNNRYRGLHHICILKEEIFR